jgi:hypothetical protein
VEGTHGPIDSLKEPEFCGPIGNPRPGKREPGDLPQDDDDPKQGDEPFDPAAQSQHFLLQPEKISVDDIHGDDFGLRGGQPAARGEARNASSGCLVNVAAGSDEIAQAMVIAASTASGGIHETIIATPVRRANPTNPSRTSVAVLTRSGDNPRRKPQNVVAISTANQDRPTQILDVGGGLILQRNQTPRRRYPRENRLSHEPFLVETARSERLVSLVQCLAGQKAHSHFA